MSKKNWVIARSAPASILRLSQVTSAAVSFSVPDTLEQGDELKLEIANLTDAAQLVVTGAQIVIS